MFGGMWGALPGFSLCHSHCWGGPGRGLCPPQRGPAGHHMGHLHLPSTHLVQGEKRIKLFAFKNSSLEFYIQNNEVPKEEEPILT